MKKYVKKIVQPEVAPYSQHFQCTMNRAFLSKVETVQINLNNSNWYEQINSAEQKAMEYVKNIMNEYNVFEAESYNIINEMETLLYIKESYEKSLTEYKDEKLFLYLDTSKELLVNSFIHSSNGFKKELSFGEIADEIIITDLLITQNKKSVLDKNKHSYSENFHWSNLYNFNMFNLTEESENARFKIVKSIFDKKFNELMPYYYIRSGFYRTWYEGYFKCNVRNKFNYNESQLNNITQVNLYPQHYKFNKNWEIENNSYQPYIKAFYRGAFKNLFLILIDNNWFNFAFEECNSKKFELLIKHLLITEQFIIMLDILRYNNQAIITWLNSIETEPRPYIKKSYEIII